MNMKVMKLLLIRSKDNSKDLNLETLISLTDMVVNKKPHNLLFVKNYLDLNPIKEMKKATLKIGVIEW